MVARSFAAKFSTSDGGKLSKVSRRTNQVSLTANFNVGNKAKASPKVAKRLAAKVKTSTSLKADLIKSGGVNLIVVDVLLPATINEGDHITPIAVVKNVGSSTMPAGTVLSNHQLDVLFTFDGDVTKQVWADLYEGTLAPGATLNMQANGGNQPGGISYVVAVAGQHAVLARVNSNLRKTESDYNDNSFTKPYTVNSLPPPSGGRAPLCLWTGVVGTDNLVAGVGGLTLANFRNAGFNGLSISLGVAGIGVIPDWMLNEWTTVKNTLGSVGVGFNLASSDLPIPVTAAQRADRASRWAYLRQRANSVGVTRSNCDGEPYGYDADNNVSNPWHESGPVGLTAQLAYDYGLAVGAEIAQIGNGELTIYASSAAAWPGSNIDQLLAQNGRPNHFVGNHFADFVDGLIAAGVKIVFNDASFHRQGTQNSSAGGNYTTALGIVRDTTLARFPGQKWATMIWPDIVEGSGAGVFWTPTEVKNAVDLMTSMETGPAQVYEHGITSGLYNGYSPGQPEYGVYPDHAYWQSVLSAVDTLGLP